MSLVDGLLNQLAVRGLGVEWRGGDTLVLTGPANEKTPEVIAAVKTFKKDLLEKYRPRDYSQASEVHHSPPTDTNDGPETCQECKSHVWDRGETATLCDVPHCPMKGNRNG